jgi:hypothetical protein
MMSDKQRNALLIELHKAIEESATRTADALRPGQIGDLFHPSFGGSALGYPPNSGVTDAEREAVDGIAASPEAVSALRKIVANAIADAFHEFFALIDAVADPADYDDFWPPIELREAEDSEDLHVLWLEGYWLWRERRPDPGWKLDAFEGPSPPSPDP